VVVYLYVGVLVVAVVVACLERAHPRDSDEAKRATGSRATN
jgi:hypothetical protein